MPSKRPASGGPGRTDGPLGAWLRSRLGGRTLGQVERATGVSKSSLSEYLRGTSFPGPAALGRLAAYFGVPPAELEGLRPSGERRRETGTARRAFVRQVVRETIAQLVVARIGADQARGLVVALVDLGLLEEDGA